MIVSFKQKIKYLNEFSSESNGKNKRDDLYFIFSKLESIMLLYFFIIFYILNRFKQYNNKILKIQIYKNVVLFYYTKNK